MSVHQRRGTNAKLLVMARFWWLYAVHFPSYVSMVRGLKGKPVYPDRQPESRMTTKSSDDNQTQ